MTWEKQARYKFKHLRGQETILYILEVMLLRNFKQKAKKLYGKHNYVFRLCPLETQESLTDILHLACATKMPVNYYQFNFKNN